MASYGLATVQTVGMFPDRRLHSSWNLIRWRSIGIIYGALGRWLQPNLKKLIAYSSVSHLLLVVWIFSFTDNRHATVG